MRAYDRKRDTTPQPGWVQRKPTDGRAPRLRRPGSVPREVGLATGGRTGDNSAAAPLAGEDGGGGATDEASTSRSVPQPPSRVPVGLGGGDADVERDGSNGGAWVLPSNGDVTDKQVPTSDEWAHDGGRRAALPVTVSRGRTPSGEAGALDGGARAPRQAGLKALIVGRGPSRNRRGDEGQWAAACPASSGESVRPGSLSASGNDDRAATGSRRAAAWTAWRTLLGATVGVGDAGRGGRAPALMEAASAAAAADIMGTGEATAKDDGSSARRATVPPDKGVVGDRTRPRRREAVSIV